MSTIILFSNVVIGVVVYLKMKEGKTTNNPTVWHLYKGYYTQL